MKKHDDHLNSSRHQPPHHPIKMGQELNLILPRAFKLPNGANRSPDVAWIRLERWNQLTSEQKSKFAPVCPDFVVELRSPSDSLQPLQEKRDVAGCKHNR